LTDHRYYSRVNRVQEAYTPDAVNSALEAGWELLAIKETTQRDFNGSLPVLVSRPVYVLGYAQGFPRLSVGKDRMSSGRETQVQLAEAL
jgi:hypothetical protein